MAKEKKAKKKKKSVARFSLVGMVFLISAFIFMPTTILVLAGMMPTIVVIIGSVGKSSKTMTVGALNFAGCFPFLLDLWTSGHSLEMALHIISDPRTIIVMYAAAGIGYLIDWSMGGIVKTIIIQRAQSRLRDIKNAQEELARRWGPEVSGEIPLDPHGYVLDARPKDKK